MKTIFTFIFLVLLSSCSREPEVVTGPFVTREGVIYDQNNNEPVTGVIVEFHENGQLSSRANYIDGNQYGLYE